MHIASLFVTSTQADSPRVTSRAANIASFESDSDLESRNSAEDLLLTLNRSPGSLPTHLASSVKHGTVSSQQLQQYMRWEQHFLVKHLLYVPGMRERMLADPGFLAKLAVEAGMGVLTKLAAELRKRPDKFWRELDLVSANTIMSLISDVMLMWIPAPRIVLHSAAPVEKHDPGSRLSRVYKFWASCPANAFQPNTSPTERFTMLQREACIVKNAFLLFVIGWASSVLGVVLTNALLFLRNLISQQVSSDSSPQQIWGISLAHGVYMATSGNVRYQVIAGIIEGWAFEMLFRNQPNVSSVSSFVLRTVNTYLGSAQWVDFIRYLGIQEA